MAEQNLIDRIVVWTLSIVLTAIGLSLLVGGVILVTKAGSPYYVLASLAVLVSAYGLFRGRNFAAIVYGIMLTATIVWAVWEVGLDGWLLAPRLVAPAVLGFAFLLSPVWRASGMVSRWWVGAPIVAVVAVIGTSAILSGQEYASLTPATAAQSADSENGEWRNWGRTLGGQRYTPLGQINAGNVSQLKPAWTYASDIPDHGGGGHSFEATPLAVDGRLYFCVDRSVVVAVDQEDGHEIWRVDPKTNLDGVYAATCRGVAYYESSQPQAECQKRILFGTHDGRLMAVDATNGQSCASFGSGGTVDLHAGMGDVPPGIAYPTSPPTIVNGVAVIGQWVTDGLALNEPSGVVRGYDAVTGALRWAWDIGHPDRTGMPPEGESYTRATPNAWGVFSGDEALGLVYLGTGNSTPDYFGAHRSPESEKYASAIVALDAATGTLRWSFQTVHHDIWDYDVMAQPVLVDVDSPQGKIPALIASTKRGALFMLDRRDGHSLDEIIEKPVPQNPAPGEWLSKTQPYPKGFPSVAGPDLREVDMWGLTPLDQLWCRIQFKGARYDGQFTPPSLQPAILYPGSAGGSNWPAVTVDPDRNLLIANTLYVADYTRLVPRAEADAMKAEAAKNSEKDSAVPEALRAGHGSHYAYLQPQAGTPYAIWRSLFISPLATLCQPPPYSRISVFDINTRKLLWSKPLGTIQHSGPFGLETHLPIPMGVPAMGGALASAGGLIFIGASQDRHFRAFDMGSGKELWSFELPAAAGAVPMSYLSKKSGRQFVVIAAGGHPAIGGPRGSQLLAFAVPAK